MKRLMPIALILLTTATRAAAQSAQPQPSVDEVLAMKQDPVSGLRSIFLQDVFAPTGDITGNSFSVQPVWPISLGPEWKMITYTIVPIQRLPDGQGGIITGLGNVVFNGYITPNKASSFKWGIGPALVLPTRTDPALGSNRLSAGPAGLVYGTTRDYSFGAVIQNFWSIGGDDANQVNTFSLQYIFARNLPGGWFLQSNSTINSNWLRDEDRWTVPVGGGFGRVFQIGKGRLFYSASAQAFYNAWHPDDIGSWSAIIQFQIILPS